MKIVLTGGGTADHAMVNKILIPLLRNEGLEVVYIGSGHGIEKEMIENQGLATYHAISTGKLRRYFSLKNVTDVFRVLKGIYQSYKIIRQEQPVVVMSGGGFVSVPVIIASWMQHIPSVTAKKIIETSESLLSTPLNMDLILSKEALANNCTEQIEAIEKVMWEQIEEKVKHSKSVDLSNISEEEWSYYYYKKRNREVKYRRESCSKHAS